MARFTIEVSEQDVPQFLNWMKEHGYPAPMAEEDEYVVPEWQKEEVLKSIAETKEEDYIPWEEVKARLFRGGK